MSKFRGRVVAVLRGLVIVSGLLALDAARADAPGVDVDRSDERVIGAVDLLTADPQDLPAAVKAAAATVSLKLTASTMIVAAPATVTLTATISSGTLKGNVIFKSCFLIDRDDVNHAYRLKTIFDLDQAYFSARLITRPDKDWLNP